MNKKTGANNIINALLILLLSLPAATFAQSSLSMPQNDELENALFEILKTNPVNSKYFIGGKKPGMRNLIKKINQMPKMDSIVSSAFDSTFSKMINTYQYDENGYFKNFTKIFYLNNTANLGYSYDFNFNQDGLIQLYAVMKLNNGVWEWKKKEEYSYDPNGNMITSITEKWDTTLSDWVFHLKMEYGYDTKNNLTTETEFSWSGSDWVPEQRSEYTYTSKNIMILKIVKGWNGTTWKNRLRYEYFYDANDNRTELLFFNWQSNAWHKSYKTSYTYDLNNNLISRFDFNWNDADNVWENYTLTLYVYNSDNQNTLVNYKKWDNSSSSWIDKYRDIYEYNENGKLIHHSYEKYNGSNWEVYSVQDYEFDDEGKLLTFTRSDDEVNKITFRYNSNGLCNGGKNELWTGDHWDAADFPYQMYLPFVYTTDYSENTLIDNIEKIASSFSGYEFSVYYQGVTSVKEEGKTPVSFSLEQNYPNPFNPSTIIKYSIQPVETQNFATVQLKVYDVLGKEVAVLVNKKQPPGIYKVRFDASNLSSGLYFYKLTAGNFSITRKMLLMK